MRRGTEQGCPGGARTSGRHHGRAKKLHSQGMGFRELTSLQAPGGPVGVSDCGSGARTWRTARPCHGAEWDVVSAGGSCPGVELDRVTRLLWAPCLLCAGGEHPLWRLEKRVKGGENWTVRQGAVSARPQGVVLSPRKSGKVEPEGSRPGGGQVLGSGASIQGSDLGRHQAKSKLLPPRRGRVCLVAVAGGEVGG